MLIYFSLRRENDKAMLIHMEKKLMQNKENDHTGHKARYGRYSFAARLKNAINNMVVFSYP